MKLYNTLTRKTEDFIPENPNLVKIYTCGPTVYNYAHIGNYTAYIYWDLLVRTLLASGYNVKRVLNLTDVGHLTSDADEGEDKLEKGARREGKTVWEIADFYIAKFMDGFRALNLTEPNVIARATNYIEADKKLVDKLIEGGYTYETSDGIYFDTSKFSHYADFARLDLEGLKAGARVEFNSEKRNPSDFAVWKFIKPGENHAMRWDYLGCPGYPGWHLECSTIIHEELGETIDIHTGGIDHIPVHHTNEIAQSESAFGRKLANYWLHCDFITIAGEKISKSLGNTYTLADLEEYNFSPLHYKMWVLSGNYNSARNFSFEDLAAAKNRYDSWRNEIAYARQGFANSDADVHFAEQQVLDAVSNNLNSAAAFSIIDNLGHMPLDFWQFIDDLFGLGLIANSPDITADQQQLIANRQSARERKDYVASDSIRTELESTGVTILDTKSGPVWQYI